MGLIFSLRSVFFFIKSVFLWICSDLLFLLEAVLVFFFYVFPLNLSIICQFSHSVMSDSLQPHGLKHARLPCPLPTPGACSDSCPSRQWCHPTNSSSVIPFSTCLQSLLASGSFPMSQFFASGGQSIGISPLASVLPMSIQDWFPLGWTGLDLHGVQKTLKSLLQHHSSKASVLLCLAFFTCRSPNLLTYSCSLYFLICFLLL